MNSSLFYTLIIFALYIYAASAQTVWVVWDYQLTYQLSVENPCREPGSNQSEICYIIETSNQLIVEPITLSTTARRSEARDTPHERPARGVQEFYYESGYADDRIYNNNLEKIVAIAAHPNGSYFVLSSNSSIYNMNAERVLLHLRGCKITPDATWSATFEPVTEVLHIFSSTGKHFKVLNINTGTCVRAARVEAGVSIVAASYAVDVESKTYSLFALDNHTNSFGSLNPHTGKYHQIKRVESTNQVGVSSFAVTYNGNKLVGLFMKQTASYVESFYPFHPATGQVGAPINQNTDFPYLSFTYPAANLTGVDVEALTFTVPTSVN